MSKSNSLLDENNQLLADICSVLINARKQLQQTVNHVMVDAYWQVGRLIVEYEQ